MQGKVIEKTWRAWDAERIDGIFIMDPDGFERGDPMMDKYVYSREEFLQRRQQCTVGGIGRNAASAAR
jgi:hypothetical protein